jgi:hypothetical protein
LGGFAGSLPEVIGHRRGGLLHRNEDELLCNLREILLDPVKAIGFGKVGRRHSEELYSPVQVLRKWEDLLIAGQSAALQPSRIGPKPEKYVLKLLASKLLPASAVDSIQRRRRRVRAG